MTSEIVYSIPRTFRGSEKSGRRACQVLFRFKMSSGLLDETANIGGS